MKEEEKQEFLEICKEIDKGLFTDELSFSKIYNRDLLNSDHPTLNHFILGVLEIKKNLGKFFLYHKNPEFLIYPRDLFMQRLMKYLSKNL